MERNTYEICAAAERNSPVWREIIELAEQCCTSFQATGSFQAWGQRYLLKSGMLITGRDAMSLLLFLRHELKGVQNLDAKDVWNDLDEIRDVFPAGTA